MDILIDCYIVGGGENKAEATQKLNHWEVFRIMELACTAEGVATVAIKYPKLALFVNAAARGEALLESRLEVLDPTQIKAHFGKSAAELRAQRQNLVGNVTKKREIMLAHLYVAREKACRNGARLLKAETQAVLARARELQGWTQASITLVLYKDASGKEHSASAFSALFEEYLKELTPQDHPVISWGSLPWPTLLAGLPAALPPAALLPAAAPTPADPPPAAAAGFRTGGFATPPAPPAALCAPSAGTLAASPALQPNAPPSAGPLLLAALSPPPAPLTAPPPSSATATAGATAPRPGGCTRRSSEKQALLSAAAVVSPKRQRR